MEITEVPRFSQFFSSFCSLVPCICFLRFLELFDFMGYVFKTVMVTSFSLMSSRLHIMHSSTDLTLKHPVPALRHPVLQVAVSPLSARDRFVHIHSNVRNRNTIGL
jgi:hypothetical protein